MILKLLQAPVINPVPGDYLIVGGSAIGVLTDKGPMVFAREAVTGFEFSDGASYLRLVVPDVPTVGKLALGSDVATSAERTDLSTLVSSLGTSYSFSLYPLALVNETDRFTVVNKVSTSIMTLLATWCATNADVLSFYSKRYAISLAVDVRAVAAAVPADWVLGSLSYESQFSDTEPVSVAAIQSLADATTLGVGFRVYLPLLPNVEPTDAVNPLNIFGIGRFSLLLSEGLDFDVTISCDDYAARTLSSASTQTLN